MSFPRYPEYKDSGVEWLREVPAHWQLMPLVRLTEAKCDGPFGSGIKSDHYTDEGALVVRLQNIRAEGFFVGESVFIDLDYFEQELLRHEVCAGDVLIAGLGDDNNVVGRACVAPAGLGPALVKADCFRFRIDRHKAKPEFVATQLTAGARFDAGRLSGGSTRSRIPLGTMANRPICLPPIDEQVQIAAFLHRETAKIDALVEEQERLIELLKEKRQAVISQAVTKGLDPNVPMKDSGVEWLGKVPAHWATMTFQRCVYIAEGQVDPRDATFASMLLIAPDHVESRTGRVLSFETAEQQGAESGKYQCQAGDVIYSKIRPALRKACLAPSECLCSADMYPLRGLPTLRNPFLLWFMLSECFSAYAILESERVAMPKINRESLKAVWLPVPPLQEQDAIANDLSAKTTEMDTLIVEAESAVVLLTERRAALISAAVTGKIDVRGLAA